MVAYACILASKATTDTFLLSKILQVSKKTLILLIVCEGISERSLYEAQAGSFSGTPINLSSTSPVSIILMIPKTLTLTIVSGGILRLEMTSTSRGSLSSPIVLGMKPQLVGKTTGVARIRSSIRSPVSQSSSNFPFVPSVISITAFMLTGQFRFSSTLCMGCLTKSGLSILSAYLSGWT